MFNATRYLPAALLAAAALVTTPACAARVYSQPYPVGDRDDRTFYNRGFNEGHAIGIEDARRGRPFDMHAHREWRDIDRQHIERDDARAYRQGFEVGYGQGYHQWARADYPPVPAYPPPRPPQAPYSSEAREGYVTPAAQNGYRDGLDEGRRDAQNRERFDPGRSRRYRSADHDYDHRYGPLDVYKREYRDAFQRGYEEGYRGFRA
jgi:hypothetical protein